VRHTGLPVHWLFLQVAHAQQEDPTTQRLANQACKRHLLYFGVESQFTNRRLAGRLASSCQNSGWADGVGGRVPRGLRHILGAQDIAGRVCARNHDWPALLQVRRANLPVCAAGGAVPEPANSYASV
jgi:hypothetical protein